MEKINGFVDIEEAKKVFYGNEGIEKASYAAMVGRTMISIDEKRQKNLQEIMNLIIECIVMENDEDVKEEMFMALRNMVSLNDEKNIKSSIKTLIDKLELLKDNDIAEALLVISYTFDIEYLELMQKYKTYPNQYVQEVVKEAIVGIELKEKTKYNK